MRIARIATDGDVDFAVQSEESGWIPLKSVGIEAPDTPSMIERMHEIRRAVEAGADGANVDESRLRAPIVRPSKIIAIGLNYIDHIKETNADQPERPVIFAKFPSSINGPFAPVVMDPSLTEMGDYEAELAVVIGRPTRGVNEKDALTAVFGYTVANDVSARDWQFKDPQFDRSKGFDTFCPIGPWITSADDVPDPQGLSIRSWVNGEPRQESSTKLMLFSVAELISFVARGMTLEPGDVILTGTPHGVGFAMNPPRYLQPGDHVECELEGLGRIRNPVVGPETR
jgi:2-keto-4-pentenoate hydratase/2-oxohepta-3-ene-1,7-dioic acid hydratase in catechol pathway